MALDQSTALRTQLLDAGMMIETGVDGLYGRSVEYETIAQGITGLTTRMGAAENALSLHFPPVIPRELLVQTDYLRSFPDLSGSVHTFRGDDKLHARLLELVDEGADWSPVLEPADVVLRPATCHSVYPLCTGRLPAGGRRFEIHGWCFRHEPSLDPARMQSFRMHEFVYVGDAEGATAHRDQWLARGKDLLVGLGLEVEIVVANDPFFGRVGKMLAANQRDEALKLEFVTPIVSAEEPTAITSVNRHEDHFGLKFDISTAKGEVAHSACFAVGVDRVALALLNTHGIDSASWPPDVRQRLWP